MHFCAAVVTEKQARQRVDFPVPIWSLGEGIFQNPLYVFKIGAVDNRRMDIFGNLPLVSVYIVVSFVAEMLCGLEVHHIFAILLPCEDTGQGRLIPFAAVSLVQHPAFAVPRPRSFM